MGAGDGRREDAGRAHEDVGRGQEGEGGAAGGGEPVIEKDDDAGLPAGPYFDLWSLKVPVF